MKPSDKQLLHAAADLLAAFADGSIEDGDRRDVDGTVEDLRVLAASSSASTATSFAFGSESITVSPGSLDSNIDRDKENPEAPWNVAMDSGESLILALVSAGVPMDTPQMREALGTWMDAMVNTFGDE